MTILSSAILRFPVAPFDRSVCSINSSPFDGQTHNRVGLFISPNSRSSWPNLGRPFFFALYRTSSTPLLVLRQVVFFLKMVPTFFAFHPFRLFYFFFAPKTQKPALPVARASLPIVVCSLCVRFGRCRTAKQNPTSCLSSASFRRRENKMEGKRKVVERAQLFFVKKSDLFIEIHREIDRPSIYL